MSGHIYIEQRAISAVQNLSWDLTHHLYSRPLKGKIVIVAKDPTTLFASFSKQWYRVLCQVERERSSTLDASRILALTQKLASVQRVRFVAKTPEQEPLGDVFFMTLDQVLRSPPECRALYATIPLSEEQQETITIQMVAHGLLVCYA